PSRTLSPPATGWWGTDSATPIFASRPRCRSPRRRSFPCSATRTSGAGTGGCASCRPGGTRSRDWIRAPRSIRHRCHPAGEGVLEAEVPQVAQALRIENAVEVIDLVLHHPGVETLDRAIDGRALEVVAAIAQPPEARDESPQAGHGKTSFPAFILLVTERRQLGIDEHGVGDRRHLGV